jgi:hypothetical protein
MNSMLDQLRRKDSNQPTDLDLSTCPDHRVMLESLQLEVLRLTQKSLLHSSWDGLLDYNTNLILQDHVSTL